MTEAFAYIAGTFDTKSEELGFVRDVIESGGEKTRTVDLSTSSLNVSSGSDVSARDVAAMHPAGIDAVFTGDRGSAVTAMAEAFRIFLGTQGDVAGAIGLGGSGGTALTAPAFQQLPYGVPKLTPIRQKIA